MCKERVVPRFYNIVLSESLMKQIFKELGNIAGLSQYEGLTELEEIIAHFLKFGE